MTFSALNAKSVSVQPTRDYETAINRKRKTIQKYALNKNYWELYFVQNNFARVGHLQTLQNVKTIRCYNFYPFSHILPLVTHILL